MSIDLRAAEPFVPSSHQRSLRRGLWDTERPGAVVAGAVAATIALAVAGRLLGVAEVALVQSFAIVAVSIVVEALPFVLLGAIVSGVIQVYVSDERFDRVARLPAALQMPVAAVGGIALPVCECGSVPIARRLIARGLHPAAGLTFMLAAPIVNPVVLLSTWIAYQGREVAEEMVLGRALLGLLVAGVTGWAIGGGRQPASQLLREQDPAPCSCCSGRGKGSIRSLADHVGREAFYMGSFVVVGAALAAALQTVAPRSLLTGLSGDIIPAILSLMLLAFVLSLCSEADAFVAVSLVQFPVGAQLAFLAFGPIVDIKLGFLYGATFRPRAVASIALVSAPLVAAGALWFQVMFR